jgi:hypothetical protein
MRLVSDITGAAELSMQGRRNDAVQQKTRPHDVVPDA